MVETQSNQKPAGLDAFRAAGAVTRDALRAELGQAAWNRLTRRQRAELLHCVRFVRLWEAFRQIRHSATAGAALEEFCEQSADLVGRDVPPPTARRWIRAYRRGGAVALVDRRGRGRPTQGVDVGLLLAFCQHVAAGDSVAEAHRKVRARAEREGLAWPRSPRSCQQWVSGQTDPRVSVGPDRSVGIAGLLGPHEN